MTISKALEPISEDPLALTKAQKALCLAQQSSTATELHDAKLYGAVISALSEQRLILDEVV